MFVVDKSGLKHLLSKVVQVTRGYNVEKLQRMYSVLSQTIYHHRKDYNKTQMLKVSEVLLIHKLPLC